MGWIFEIALTGLLFKAIDYGGGTDLWNVSKENYMHFTKVSALSLSTRSTDYHIAIAA